MEQRIARELYRMKHKLLAMLLIAAMVITMLPSAIHASEGVSYVDEEGVVQSTYNAISITSSMKMLTGSWYVVDSDVTTTNALVGTNTKVILMDGYTWTANGSSGAGVGVSAGNKLTIYGQENGTGKLVAATSQQYSAGIGASSNKAAGTITINGGIVDATGSQNGAGIGGAMYFSNGTTVINGGSVLARGQYGAGIGGGSGSSGSNRSVTINGGNVDAASLYGAGIGGGRNDPGGVVTINGGIVEAESDTGAGIGGGEQNTLASAPGGTVTINGGTIIAKSTGTGAGIGGGSNRGRGTVTINGGEIQAEANDGAGIGSGDRGESSGSITIAGGSVDAESNRGAGIGGGANSTGGTVTISGGTIIARSVGTSGGGYGAGIGGGTSTGNDYGDGGHVYISGGNVKASGNADGEAIGGGQSAQNNGTLARDEVDATNVFLTVVSLEDVTAPDDVAVSSIEVRSMADYGVKDVTTIDGKLYLYMPDGSSVAGVTTETGKYGGALIAVKNDHTATGSFAKLSTDATLSALQYQIGIGDAVVPVAVPNFSAETEEYHIELPVDTLADADIYWTATTTDSQAEVVSSQSTPVRLVAGQGQATIEVRAPDGSVTKTYTVHFTTAAPVTYAVTLPAGPGYMATANASFSSPVVTGRNFNFTVVLDADYDQSTVIVKTNGAVIPGLGPVLSKVYMISNITSDQVVTIEGVELNPVAFAVVYNANGGSVSQISATTDEHGKLANLLIPTRRGYSFGGWFTAAEGGTEVTTDTVFSADTTIYAHWTYSGGGSSGYISSPINSDDSFITVIPPASEKPYSPTQGEISLGGEVNAEGKAAVVLTAELVTDAINQALENARNNGNEDNGITVVLRVDAGDQTVSGVNVNLPKTVQDIIVSKKIVHLIVVVDRLDISIGMDLAAVTEIHKQANADVSITADRIDGGLLSGSAQAAIGNRPVFELGMSYGQGGQVKHFGSGTVKVAVPYTLGANEKAGNVQAVYVDEGGTVQWLVGSVYDSEAKVLRFGTDHFSVYGVGYKPTIAKFADIADHWAKEDIDFAASRQLFNGTSATTFSPNSDMTRGMFIAVLGRLANADVSGYEQSRFTDVKSDAYYTGYIEWATRHHIVNGVGYGKFAPDQSITREQMATIMANYVRAIDYTLPKVNEARDFADDSAISDYARDAVRQMQMADIVKGKNEHGFDPQGTASRAEVSALLHRFLELTAGNGAI